MKTQHHLLQLCMFAMCGFLILLGFSSCNEQSPIAGSDLHNDTINASVITSDSVQMFLGTSLLNNKPTASYPVDLLLGSAKGYTSSTILRFSPDNLPDSSGYEILSAQMILQPKRYAFGDTISNRLAFDVFSIAKPWTPSATIDTFQQAGFLESVNHGTFDGSIALRDTMPEVTMDISTSLIKGWFESKVKKLKDTSYNTQSSYAIALVPKSNSTVIRSFARTKQVVDVATNSKSTDEAISIRVICKKTNATKNDTIVVKTAYHGSFTSDPSKTSDAIIVNCGTGVYSGLDISLQQLPTGIAIHGAILKLTLDSASSLRGNFPIDSILTAQFVDSSYGNLIREFSGWSKSGSNIYEFSVVNALVESLLRKSRVGTLKVFPFIDRDRTRLDRLVFHGPKDPDPTKRPSLRIIYSTRPKP
ncbi:MAG: hypothetical protein EBU66_12860 [Bacteroidetes bacterium]|nr:hypothetical protein [bacterium]NBP65536.1 hypothetical protein [Bacteroidota bacterium]